MDVRAFINKQNWIYAKTYASKAPHEYILRHKVVGTEAEFEEFIRYIQAYGFKAKFWNMEHIYFYLDGKFYWTMGSPIEETIVINRCNADDYEVFMKMRSKHDLQGD